MNKVNRINSFVKISILCLLGIVFLFPKTTKAQNIFEMGLRAKMDSLIAEKGPVNMGDMVLLPNNAVQSLMTPSGWGGGNSTYLFGVIGGVYPAMYTDPNVGDLVAAFGISGGNPKKYVNASLSVNISRVDNFKDFSVNLILSRQILKGSSISVGALSMFADPAVSDAPNASYYIALSHAAQSVRSRTPGYAGLSYTIGYGVGRFLYKSPQDIAHGKGKYGTGFFANVSYEVLRQINLNAEWGGMNLGFSSGVRPLKGSALTFGFGVYNLTSYSGDRIQYIGSLSLPIALGKRIENRKDRLDRIEREKRNKRDEKTPSNFRGGENGLIIRN
ncbi:hypothetical protein WG904_06065 [Pedobacter sp. Du54]|uniref:hypothetical protein n=1 Tax=Pedobacter anseongensis TaxID=3133439 RepID=UPI0030A9E1F2